jgi:hypothetical protein
MSTPRETLRVTIELCIVLLLIDGDNWEHTSEG